MRRARVLVADPPWKFGDGLPGKRRGAARNYRCMTVAAIARFPLPPLEDDALLCIWRVAAMQQEALDVIKAWGFTLKAEIVWEKLTKRGKAHFGMGRLTRGSHEVCLLATRGKFKRASASVRSRFAAPVAKHSAKPDRFYELVEELAGHGPYVELFARRERRGWLCFGKQLRGRPAAPPRRWRSRVRAATTAIAQPVRRAIEGRR